MTTTPAPTITVLTPSGTQTGPFSTVWTYSDPEDVRVYIETEGDRGPDLVEDVDYTLAGATPEETGGAVTLYLAAVPDGGWVEDGAGATRLIIYRHTIRRQATALADVEGHKPRATERGLDRAMRIAQELTDDMALAVRVPPGTTPPTPADLADAANAGAQIAAAVATANAALAAVALKADKDLGNVAVTRGDDDAVAVDEPDYRAAQPRLPIEFGATPQETAYDTDLDNTAELQAMIDGAFNSGATLPGLPGGGVVIIDKVYRIDAPLYMRKWITLRGVIQGGELLDHDGDTNSNADKTATTLGAVPGTIICGPSGKVVPKDCCHIDKLRIISDELAKVSPNGDEAALRAQIVNYQDYEIAIDPVFGACDVSVTNSFIAGFELACRFSYTERYRFNLNKVDCVNGLFVTDIYDHSEINFNSFWPYGIAHRLGSGGETLATAYGTAIKFGKNPAADRSTDGGTVIGNMIYGYSYGLDLEATNALHVAFNWIDNNRGRADTQDTTGIRMSGNCRRTKLIGNHVDSYGRSYDIQADGGVIFNDNTSAGCTYSHLRVGPSVILIGGTFFMQDYVTGQGGPCIELNDSHVQVVFDRLVFAGCGNAAVSTLSNTTAIMNFRVSKFSFILPHASFVALNPDQFTSVVAVSRTSDAALSGNNVDNTISFPNTLLDGYSEWSGGNTMTVKRAGWYMIDVNLLATPPSTAAGLMQAYLRVNGSGVRICSAPHEGHTNPISFALTASPIYLAKDDAVTVTMRSLINAGFNLKGDLCVFTARFVERP